MGPCVCLLVFLAFLAAAEGDNDTAIIHHIYKRSSYKGYGSRGCLDLRSKRYISDGFCTTVRPVAEAVCVVRCQEPLFESTVANSEIPESTTQVEWRCSQGATKRKMIRFLCRDGTHRVYPIRLVTKCICKKVPIDKNNKHSKSSKKMKRIQ